MEALNDTQPHALSASALTTVKGINQYEPFWADN